MPTYNKLVRDLIPDIIRNSGKEAMTSILSEDNFRAALRTKLSEEVQEYLTEGSDEQALEELADILEVVSALAKLHGSTFEETLSIQAKKARERGGFGRRIFLIEVNDES
ncbi:nucleoside triphosphate pyrophosphohydrolase [Alicyclobacillus ferrooxydans]|uniref:Phosphoribosyl-ATP pyrophosphohydrolase n=1 Tax=Alicyclobacillus ferrooxydans TaxID=471514 RepID=A0A0P9CBS9_9BACL|nr:nucleoside triphosphate pyrophosphohydrolase [Alicyclobacillus ferrooxydans]KPV43018.1 phosphoribosyl-ATP pyrophosphohydrolase [Alicyclobacillus ferrooxydans]